MKMHNLLSILPLKQEQILQILEVAKFYYQHPKQYFDILKGKLLINFFFENSTRTRISFELSAKKMGAEVINLDISLSSLKKGETIIDTAKTLSAMQPDFVAIRHNSSGILQVLQQHISASLINAGDGTNEHPSQALLDAFTILQHKKTLQGLKVAICGDVLHSRVARSNIFLLSKFGCSIKIATPPTLVPFGYQPWLKQYNVEICPNLHSAITDADVIMMLRVQQERMASCYISSFDEYFELYGLDRNKLKLASKAIILHPGPINRQVEIDADLAYDLEKSCILDQVKAGVAVRMAILQHLNFAVC
jgi:aspartate carbamoyltransferase catalytic subunit